MAEAHTSYAGEWRVASPDGSLVVRITVHPTFQWRIEKEGKTALNWSRLGIRLAAVDFTRDIQVVSEAGREITEQYNPVHGVKERYITHCNEVTLSLKNATGDGLCLTVRAYNEGAAFRYTVQGSGRAAVLNELSTFTVQSGSVSWCAGEHREYQDYWRFFDGNASGWKQFPVLIKTPADQYLLITESAVYGTFCSSHLEVRGTDYQVGYPQSQVNCVLPLELPWRVVLVGTLKNIIENTQQVVNSMNPPSEIQDESWIKPGRVSWSWLTDGVRDIEQQRRFVDFAAEMGWEYCLVDEGWRKAAVPELSQYAESKKVGLITWYHFSEMRRKAQREKLLAQARAYGIKGVKVDFPMSDTRARMKWYDAMTEAAARHKMLVCYHGCTLPRGQERRWPNCMTMEAIRGAEQYTLGANGVTREHNCIIPYTRNAVGPMDYTPVVFSLSRPTTRAHELAQSVVYTSSLQHFGDNPESYKSMKPPVIPFLKAVAAAWDDVHFLGGAPGHYICLARRKGADWFIAGINGDGERTVTLDLSFLAHGSYTVNMYSDVNKDSQDMQLNEITLNSSETQSIIMAPGGGFCCHVPDSYISATL